MGVIPLVALFAAMLVSCPILPDLNDLGTLNDNEFYAQNMENEKYYKVQADRLCEGARCVIWAEKGSGITIHKAREIAHEYDAVIRPRIVETFSKKDFSVVDEDENDNNYFFDDMLDYANWLAGGDDGKLTILLLDIKDGYNDSTNSSYVAGYFFNGNFWPKGKISGTAHYSNSRDMIYIDTYPGLEKESQQTYATFAHELQHLINYVTGVQMNRRSPDVWVDEGLSSQAEYLYLERNPKNTCEWFSNDSAGTIAKGNNFFVWGNDTGDPMSILDEYATVYLFFRWLYLQADAELQSHIFRDIETSNYYDYRVITNVAKNIDPAWSNWETLLKTWFAANYNPQSAEYGYKDDAYLQTGDGDKFHGIKVKPIAGSSISLRPGEGVYSIMNNSFSVAAGTNIRYAGLGGGSGINTSSPYKGDILLTFNANTDKAGKSETGKLTGVTPLVASRMAAENARTFTGPYVIDAQDLLGRAQR